MAPRRRKTANEKSSEASTPAEKPPRAVAFPLVLLLGAALGAVVTALYLYAPKLLDIDDRDPHVLPSWVTGGLQGAATPVEVRMLTPGEAYAESVAAAGRPVVLRNTEVARWPAQKRWSAEYFARRAPRLSGVYGNSHRFFGPYYNEQRPLGA